MNSYLVNAIEILGGQTALAKEVGVTQGLVWQWLNNIRPIAPERAVDIERATKGQVTRRDLCPDFPWGETPKKKAA